MTDLIETFKAMLATEPALLDMTDHVIGSGDRLRHRRRRTVAAAVGAAALIGTGTAVPLALRGDGRRAQSLTVGRPHPHTVVPVAASNAYPAEATAALCAAGLHPLYVTAPPITGADTGINGYAVTSLSPPPGSKVRAGSTVRISLAESANGGPASPVVTTSTTVPSVTGLDVNKALSVITALGLHADVTVSAPTGSLQVTGQTPAAASQAPGGSTVTLRVGQAGTAGCPAGTGSTVPSVVGAPASTGLARLQAAGVQKISFDARRSREPLGQIIHQTKHLSDTNGRLASVELTVSAGVDPTARYVTVPGIGTCQLDDVQTKRGQPCIGGPVLAMVMSAKR
jgi:beta-lactam-binding protein with PASTA domain